MTTPPPAQPSVHHYAGKIFAGVRNERRYTPGIAQTASKCKQNIHNIRRSNANDIAHRKNPAGRPSQFAGGGGNRRQSRALVINVFDFRFRRPSAFVVALGCTNARRPSGWWSFERREDGGVSGVFVYLCSQIVCTYTLPFVSVLRAAHFSRSPERIGDSGGITRRPEPKRARRPTTTTEASRRTARDVCLPTLRVCERVCLFGRNACAAVLT